MFRTVFLLIMLLHTSVFCVAQGLSMSPTRLFFSGNPGDVVRQTIKLHNSSDRSYSLTTHMKDWDRGEDGEKKYYEAGTLPQSNAVWLSVSENTVTLAPGSTKEITVTMRIPAAAAANVTNSMLFFTQLPTQEDHRKSTQGLGVITLFELGAHIYNTPPQNLRQHIEITAMDQNDSNQLLVQVRNDGNTVADATVKFEMTHTATGAEHKLQPVSISMLPGTVQIIRFQLPDQLSGDYLGVALVQTSASNDVEVGEKLLKF